MNKAQIIAALKRELDALPVYPVMDSAHALQCYDENMNQALEDLRDVCKSIVEEEQED